MHTPTPARRANTRVTVLPWAAAAALGLACAGTATAQESLEEITISATRLATPVQDAPVSVTVISSEVIERQLARDIKELVRFEPGVSVRRAPARFTAAGASTGRDGNSGFNIRGMEGNRVLIQVDGVRTPDAYSFGGQSVGRGDYVDLHGLEHVEIDVLQADRIGV